MDGIWNRYNLKSTGRIYTFSVFRLTLVHLKINDFKLTLKSLIIKLIKKLILKLNII